MKIVYAGVRNENYNTKRPFSFEYSNFYLTLKRIPGSDVIEYPCDSITSIGKKKWNSELLFLIKNKRPNLFFAFMFSDELDKNTLDEIKKITKSVAWFADDHWRIWNYSRHWAPHFSWAATTWSKAPEIYAHYGIKNIIHSQWAANMRLWKPVSEAKKDIDVSFVGQRTAVRAKVVERIRRAGINVYVRGWGWPEGRVSHEEMLAIFSRSKICLNINDAPNRFSLRALSRLFLARYRDRIMPNFKILDNLKTWSHFVTLQIKARPFELSACAAFVISGYADDLENYYRPGKEMVFYRNTAELIESVKYYLPREENRERIARAGYERTLREHTYEERFKKIFNAIGLPYGG